MAVYSQLFFWLRVDKNCPRTAFFSNASWTRAWIDFVHRQFIFLKHRGQILSSAQEQVSAGIKKGPPFRMALVLQNTFSD
jgi:hypothetical protein